MNAVTAIIPKLSHEEYFALEQASPIKHEYVAGQVYAMTGISDAHNIIAGNIYMLLRNHLKGTPCRVFMADVKAKLETADAYYYPDVMVSCEPSPNPYYRQQPKLIVEVLSDSTAKYDSGEKRRNCQTVDSLQEYILVSQNCMDVRVWRRDTSGWSASICTDGMNIPLNSVGMDIPIGQVYEDVWD